MKRLEPSALDAFSRQYRFRGGRLARLKLIHQRGQLDIESVIVCRTAVKDLATSVKRVKLRLRFVNVAEYRFQKRPGSETAALPDFKLGYLDGTFFATFDSWSLQPGERPAVHDFRGSEAYIGCGDLLVEEIA